MYGFGYRSGVNRRSGNAPVLSAWTATSIVDSRTGFASVLPEFTGHACPEQEDPAAIYVSFAPGDTSGAIIIGEPVFLECALTGTFVGGALAATGSVGGFDLEVDATVIDDVLTGTVTITNGSHEEVRLFAAAAGSPITAPGDYWVDSVNGSDSNDGLTSATPKQTIAGLLALGLASGDVIRLARGSRWREYLDTGSGVVDLTISAYGVGPRAILDAFDSTLAASWTKTGGRTNVYQRSFTTVAGGASFSAIALENGRQLLPVADQAACDALAGSYVVVNPAVGGTFTLYVHLLDNTAPADNEVEITVRENSLYTRGSAQITGIMTRGGWQTSGGLYVDASGAAIDEPFVDDCVSEFANDHTMYLCGGTLSRSIARSGAGGTNGVTLIVFHRNTIDAAAEMEMVDCGAINPVDLDARITSLTQKPNAFNSHATAGFWADQRILQCGSARTGGWAIRLGLVDECLFELTRCQNNATISQVTSTQTLAVTNSRFNSVAATGHNGQSIQYGGTLIVENCAFTRTGDSVAGGYIFANGTATVRYCRFQNGATDPVNDLSAALSCTFERNVCITRGPQFATAGSALTPSNYNVCLSTGNWRENSAASARAFSTYKSSNAYGNDANSSTTLPSYEAEAVPTRPVYLETVASLAARGFDCGPAQGKPGSGVSWVTPPTYEAWAAFELLL